MPFSVVPWVSGDSPTRLRDLARAVELRVVLGDHAALRVADQVDLARTGAGEHLVDARAQGAHPVEDRADGLDHAVGVATEVEPVDAVTVVGQRRAEACPVVAHVAEGAVDQNDRVRVLGARPAVDVHAGRGGTGVEQHLRDAGGQVAADRVGGGLRGRCDERRGRGDSGRDGDRLGEQGKAHKELHISGETRWLLVGNHDVGHCWLDAMLSGSEFSARRCSPSQRGCARPGRRAGRATPLSIVWPAQRRYPIVRRPAWLQVARGALGCQPRAPRRQRWVTGRSDLLSPRSRTRADRPSGLGRRGSWSRGPPPSRWSARRAPVRRHVLRRCYVNSCAAGAGQVPRPSPVSAVSRRPQASVQVSAVSLGFIRLGLRVASLP